MTMRLQSMSTGPTCGTKLRFALGSRGIGLMGPPRLSLSENLGILNDQKVFKISCKCTANDANMLYHTSQHML